MKLLKRMIFYTLSGLFVAAAVYGVQQAIVSTDTLNEAWIKETANNSDLQININGKQTILAEGAFVDGDKTNLDNQSGTNTGDNSANSTYAIGSATQAWDADLDTWATVTPSANGKSLVSAVDYAAMKVLLNLVISTDIQAYDADLTTWAGISPSANIQTFNAAATYQAAVELLEGSNWDWTGTNSMGPLAFTSTVTPPASDGQWRYVSGVTGWTSKIFEFYSTAVQYMLSYDTLPTVNGSVPTYNAANDDVDWIVLTEDAIEFVIDGGGSAITTGVKGYLEIPYDCTINSVTMLADQSGSIVIDLWVDTYANYPPLDADSITASAVPTISTALKSQDETLTGWTVALSKGDIIGFNVDSITTCERVTLSLKVDK